jgi:hypothetical protein
MQAPQVAAASGLGLSADSLLPGVAVTVINGWPQ